MCFPCQRSLTYIFLSEWSIINKTLEAADRAHPPIVDPIPRPALQRRAAPAVPKHSSKPPTGGSAAVVPSAKAEPRVEPTTPVPAPSASRPVIKLKVNAQSTATSSQSEVPVPKSKNRKSKTGDAPLLDAIVAPSLEPPPPYIDDGSHDILQEVIAIEREKKQRFIAEKEREKPVVNGAIGKRKKSGSNFDEDDILALATPSKKERVSPPVPSTSKPKSIPPPKLSQPAPPKAKKDKHADITVTPKVGNDLHRASIKGKEREVQSSGSTTPVPMPNQSSKVKKHPVMVTPINEKKSRDFLKMIQKIPDAAIFLRPVDPDVDGCPTWVILAAI